MRRAVPHVLSVPLRPPVRPWPLSIVPSVVIRAAQRVDSNELDTIFAGRALHVDTKARQDQPARRRRALGQRRLEHPLDKVRHHAGT